MSKDWHIAFSALNPYADWIDLSWPEGSVGEQTAWSGFCGHLEYLQRHRKPLVVPVDKLTPKQVEDAVHDITKRGWAVERVVDDGVLKLRIEAPSAGK